MSDVETTKSRPRLGKVALSWAVGGFALTAALTGAMGAGAQTFASHNTRAPVSVDAGSIAVDDRSNRVVMSGGVEINQAGLKVRSNRMLANYSDNGSVDVERFTANGGVVVTRGNERASGDVAVYDIGQRLITLSGNVRLSRGSDNLQGGRLVINLASGRTSIDGRSSGGASQETGSDGRVRATFSVPQD